MNIKQLLIATILLLSSGAYGQSELDEAKLLAEQGDVDAQLNLGGMYGMGVGVPQNDVKAYVWFSVIAAQGNERAKTAKTARDRVSERLTPDQLARGQEIAIRCFESDFQNCDEQSYAVWTSAEGWVNL
jgi:TPR repeat protein